MYMNKIIAGMLSFTFLFGILASDCSMAYAKAWDSSDTSAAIGILGSIIDSAKSKKKKNEEKKDSTSNVIKKTPIRKNLSYNERMFMEAVKNNDEKNVIEMLKTGVDINAYYEDYLFTPLGMAIYYKKRDMQQVLLSNGADVTGFTIGNRKFSYLVYAASEGDFELFKYLHNWGADINDVNIDVVNVTRDKNFIIINNSLTAVLYYNASKILIPPGYGQEGEYLLEMVSYMLDEGINPNFIKKDYYRQTYDSSLTLAAGLSAVNSSGYITVEFRRAIVKRLLEAGADADFKNSKGVNAADIMLSSGWCHPSDVDGTKLIQSYMKK